MITRIDLYQNASDLVDDWPSEDIDTIDLDASAERYMTMLAKYVKTDHPQAIVTWTLTDVTPRTPAYIECDESTREVEFAQAQIDDDGARIYESQEWIVYKEVSA